MPKVGGWGVGVGGIRGSYVGKGRKELHALRRKLLSLGESSQYSQRAARSRGQGESDSRNPTV